MFYIFGHKNCAILSFYHKKGIGATVYRDPQSLKKGRTDPMDGHIAAKKMQNQAA